MNRREFNTGVLCSLMVTFKPAAFPAEGYHPERAIELLNNWQNGRLLIAFKGGWSNPLKTATGRGIWRASFQADRTLVVTGMVLVDGRGQWVASKKIHRTIPLGLGDILTIQYTLETGL